MLADVSAERLYSDVESMVGFHTRHTLSETESATRGVGAARRWVAAQFEEVQREVGADRLHVYVESNPVEPDGRRITRPVDAANVMAVLVGTMPGARERYYYMLGHLDSRVSDANDAEGFAPGANDDASGVAGLIEACRVMAGHEFDATLVFMATTGEEQGLYGARGHADQAERDGIDVRGVLNNDMIGDPASPSGAVFDGRVRVFSEGLPTGLESEDAARMRSLAAEADSPSRQLARYIGEVAALHGTEVAPLLIHRHDRFLRGGDHTPFNEKGWPAVRFCVVDEDYDRQHQDVRVEDGRRFGDLLEYIDPEYLANVTRVNVAALAHLANGPSSPGSARIIVATLDNDTTLRWEASPEPDVAGYEVVWRETTSAVWQHAKDVGNVTEATVPVSKDNHFLGVRAYDGEGYRSVVAFPRAARE